MRQKQNREAIVGASSLPVMLQQQKSNRIYLPSWRMDQYRV